MNFNIKDVLFARKKMNENNSDTYQSKEFMNKHSNLAYDDATVNDFWKKAEESGAKVTSSGAEFEDGSKIVVDHYTCSMQSKPPSRLKMKK